MTLQLCKDEKEQTCFKIQMKKVQLDKLTGVGNLFCPVHMYSKKMPFIGSNWA